METDEIKVWLIGALLFSSIGEWLYQGWMWIKHGYSIPHTLCNMLNVLCTKYTTDMIGLNKILFIIGTHSFAWITLFIAILLIWSYAYDDNRY